MVNENSTRDIFFINSINKTENQFYLILCASRWLGICLDRVQIEKIATAAAALGEVKR
jgi:hypothetical protein